MAQKLHGRKTAKCRFVDASHSSVQVKHCTLSFDSGRCYLIHAFQNHAFFFGASCLMGFAPLGPLHHFFLGSLTGREGFGDAAAGEAKWW